MANEYRVTQVAAEVLHSGNPQARVSQVAAEVLHGGSPSARITLLAIEVLRSIDSPAAGRRRQLMGG